MNTIRYAPSSSIELLEARIAPASLTLIDLNGDRVTFKASLPGPFSVTSKASGDGVHDQFTVDLGSAMLEGTNFSVTVVKGPHGDGVVDIADLNAGNNNLGTVTLAADLEEITAGHGGSALKLLSVKSLGRFEGVGGTLQNSNVVGGISALVVKGNVDGTDFGAGSINSISIGGSLLGGPTGQADDGQITAIHIGKVSIKGDVHGSYGSYTGAIFAEDDIGKVTIGGSLIGGAGALSGIVGAEGNIGSVAITGSVEGGMGNGSATVYGGNLGGGAGGTIGKITVGGSVIGGDGQFSGLLGSTYQQTGSVSVTSVTIGKNIVGGNGAASGGILATNGAIGSLTLRGSLVGGDSSTGESGFIESDLKAGTFSIAGSLYGGSLGESGALDLSGGIATLKIGGSIFGGRGTSSGSVNSGATIGLLSIHGDVVGGNGNNSGYVNSGTITTKVIGGIILPGTGTNSGTITP